ncbi:hypothetical protein Hdeb2414_s0079g00779201 [Helianthus debilis subsp. tardiflorus]
MCVLEKGLDYFIGCGGIVQASDFCKCSFGYISVMAEGLIRQCSYKSPCLLSSDVDLSETVVVFFNGLSPQRVTWHASVCHPLATVAYPPWESQTS